MKLIGTRVSKYSPRIYFYFQTEEGFIFDILIDSNPGVRHLMRMTPTLTEEEVTQLEFTASEARLAKYLKEA